jgi:hypothetical protein
VPDLPPHVGHVEIERESFLSYSWRAWGVLRRPQTGPRTTVLPTGHPGTVERGYALTRWGAKRMGNRALRRWT